MRIILTAAPGPAKLIRRKLYYSVDGITSIDSWPTIRATRDGIGSTVPDFFIAIGRRSPRALGRLAHQLGELGCPQLISSGLEAECLIYRNATERPIVICIPTGHSVTEGLIEVTRQFISSMAQATEVVTRRRRQVEIGREVQNIVCGATQSPPDRQDPDPANRVSSPQVTPQLAMPQSCSLSDQRKATA